MPLTQPILLESSPNYAQNFRVVGLFTNYTKNICHKYWHWHFEEPKCSRRHICIVHEKIKKDTPLQQNASNSANIEPKTCSMKRRKRKCVTFDFIILKCLYLSQSQNFDRPYLGPCRSNHAESMFKIIVYLDPKIGIE
jgi:hypothetical protein